MITATATLFLVFVACSGALPQNRPMHDSHPVVTADSSANEAVDPTEFRLASPEKKLLVDRIRKRLVERKLTAEVIQTQSIVLNPSEDSYIRGGNFTQKNYGSQEVLLIRNDQDESFDRKALIKFNLRSVDIPETLTAKLRLHPSKVMKDQSRTVYIEKLRRNRWKEETISWQTLDTNVEKSGPTFEVKRSDEGKWLEVDISDLIEGNVVTLFLYIRGAGSKYSAVKFDSRESSFPPELVIVPSSLPNPHTTSRPITSTSKTATLDPVTVSPKTTVSTPTSPTSSVTCSDSPEDWYDSYGSWFDCKWYEENNCPDEGDQYRNFGLTAQEACCACGGGSTTIGAASCPNPSYVLMDVAKPWEEHERTAIRQGCNLSSIHSLDELSVVLVAAGNRAVWIGGKRKEGSADSCGSARCWEWSDGSSWKFENWAVGEPNNGVSGEERVKMNPDGQWINTLESNAVAAVYKCCPAGSTRCSNPSYVLMDVNKPWEEHEFTAGRQGCNLASIHSSDELNAVRAVAGDRDVWIGGRTKEGEGSVSGWEWSDGSAWDFINWAIGEPNNFGEVEDRVRLNPDGRWSDIPESTGVAAVYKCCSGA